MALPVLGKTWQFNANNAQTAQGSAQLDNRTLLLALKNAMIGFATNAWTVKYSCNSVTAGTAGDGVDRWTTVANVVNANAGSPHSWIVVQQTGIGTTYQICIDYSNSNANAIQLTLVQSASAGFTGGTTTARPTATDETLFLNNTQWINNTADVAFRWNVMQSTDGQCTRLFVFSGGVLEMVWAFEKGANATTGTPGASNTGWGLAVFTVAALNTFAGTTRQNGVNIATVLSYESTSNLSIASEVSGAFDIFPIAIMSTATVGARGRLFTLQDIWYGSSGVATGDTAPSSGTTGQFVQIGQIVLPWNNTALQMT